MIFRIQKSLCYTFSPSHRWRDFLFLEEKIMLMKISIEYCTV